MVVSSFTVQDMTCGHCAGAITTAIKAADPAGTCEIDLAAKRVRVQSTLPAERLAKVIRDAGYSPVAA